MALRTCLPDSLEHAANSPITTGTHDLPSILLPLSYDDILNERADIANLTRLPPTKARRTNLVGERLRVILAEIFVS